MHILSGDLIMHKRTLEPIRTMVYGSRRYDSERCRAVADNMALGRRRYCDTESESATYATTRLEMDPVLVSRAKRKRQSKCMVKESGPHLRDGDDHREVEEHQRGEGFFRYKSKVYLVRKFSLGSVDALFTRELGGCS